MRKCVFFTLLPLRFAYTEYNRIDGSTAYEDHVTAIDYNNSGSK